MAAGDENATTVAFPPKAAPSLTTPSPICESTWDPRARRASGDSASTTAETNLRPSTSTALAARSPARLAEAFCSKAFSFLSASCFSERRVSTLDGRSSREDPSLWATKSTVSKALSACRCAPSPATASMRRVPAAIALSWTTLMNPISPVVATWVPAQSSRLYPPMSTTRTTLPYFSPKKARVPSGFLSKSTS